MKENKLETRKEDLIRMLERMDAAGGKGGIEISLKRIYEAMQIALEKTAWGHYGINEAWEYERLMDAVKYCIEDLEKEV